MRTTTVLLLSGDYADRLDDLYGRAEQVEQSERPARLGESSEYAAIRAEYEALKAEAEAAATKVSLEAIGRKQWRALKERHPPRKGDDVDEDVRRGDRAAGVNIETVEDDLVYASLVEPKFESRAQYDEWADSLSEAEFQTVLFAAWKLVNVARTDPKSLPASPTRSSD